MPTDLSEWISLAEAARLRGVSRQAMSKLVKQGRLETLNAGGRQLVHRKDVLNFAKKRSGRPKRINK
ncbi:MAG: helix-turn-helix domain-containing protein [Betaproteobacteria bacterium]|nr:helix-turn-helix domain-containing protein [Betaproteobacteria bacterium]